jgi:glycosyltransferase involved in cell wall biosynthesis
MGEGPSMLVDQPFTFERRVLHVAQPDVGGVPAYVDALSAFQSESGWEVPVAGPVSPSSPSVGHHLWTAARNPVVGLAPESRALRKIIDAVQPDVVMLHSAKAGLVGRLVLRGAIPTVYVPHAWSFLSLPTPMSTQAAVWERLAARWTNLVMTVSEGEARLGIDAGVNAPMVVVANPAPPAGLGGSSQDPARLRDHLTLPDRPTVVSVGRLCEQKGQDILLASWQTVTCARTSNHKLTNQCCSSGRSPTSTIGSAPPMWWLCHPAGRACRYPCSRRCRRGVR